MIGTQQKIENRRWSAQSNRRIWQWSRPLILQLAPLACSTGIAELLVEGRHWAEHWGAHHKGSLICSKKCVNADDCASAALRGHLSNAIAGQKWHLMQNVIFERAELNCFHELAAKGQDYKNIPSVQIMCLPYWACQCQSSLANRSILLAMPEIQFLQAWQSLDALQPGLMNGNILEAEFLEGCRSCWHNHWCSKPAYLHPQTEACQPCKSAAKLGTVNSYFHSLTQYSAVQIIFVTFCLCSGLNNQQALKGHGRACCYDDFQLLGSQYMVSE